MEKFFLALLTVVGYILFVTAVLFLVGTLFAFPVMWIWNWLIPALFIGAPTLTFWQAFWGTFLCSLLFKSNNFSQKK